VRALRAVRPSPATVIATIALMVALAGTGYAATSLPANSVGNKQLQTGAVTASKVRIHTLLKANFAPGQLQRGAPGAPGPPGAQGGRGPTGAQGPSGTAATRWALVGKDGNIVAGTTGIVVLQSAPGQYYVNFGSPVVGHAIVVTPAFRPADSIAGRGTTIAAICGNTGTSPPPDTLACSLNNNTSTVFVVTFQQANGLAESHPFYIAVL
jgi:hypothetical protein